MANVKPLKFSYLKYDVKEITKLISKYPDINNFVFGYYVAEHYKGVQLVASIRLGDDCNAQTYAPETNILTLNGDKFFEPDHAVILYNNFISITAMKELIASGEPAYLYFTPAINLTGHLYYLVGTVNDALTRSNDDPLKTNPSPPAIMST